MEEAMFRIYLAFNIVYQLCVAAPSMLACIYAYWPDIVNNPVEGVPITWRILESAAM